MIPKEDGFLVLKGYQEPPLCLGNKNLQCGECRWLEVTGCVGTLLGMASWPTEDNHSLQVNILLGSEKPNHQFPVTKISPLSKGPPNKRSPTLYCTWYLQMQQSCGHVQLQQKGVLFPWLMLSSLIPNATAEIRSMIHAYLFSGSCQGDG